MKNKKKTTLKQKEENVKQSKKGKLQANLELVFMSIVFKKVDPLSD